MKIKQHAYPLALLAVALAGLASGMVQLLWPAAFSSLLAFPFEQLGLGLRALSLSGPAGNAAAATVYGAACLLPVLLWGLARTRRAALPEDLLLLLLTALLFAALYLMVNPALIPQYFGGLADAATGKAMLGCGIDSVLLGYLVLRALRAALGAKPSGLRRGCAWLLRLVGALFVWAVTGCMADYAASLRALPTALPGWAAGGSPGAARLFLTLRLAVEVLPHLLALGVVFAALALLGQLSADRYGEGTARAAALLVRRSAVALAATVLCGVAFNLAQLAFAPALQAVQIRATLPLGDIGFVLAALLLAQLLREGRAMKADNDLFI